MEHAATQRLARAATTARPATPLLHRLLSWMLEADRRHRQRRAMAALDDHLRRDIGLTDSQIREEAGREWDPPSAFWTR